MYVPAWLHTPFPNLINTCANDLHHSKRNLVSLDRSVSVLVTPGRNVRVHEEGIVHVSVVCLCYTDSVLQSPDSVVLHLFVFIRVHFSPFITFSPVILLSPKVIHYSLTLFRLSHSIFLLPEAWLALKLVPSASSSVIYNRKSCCLLWSGAHFHL